jgi:non-specific serine/threonine protein kinase/serine/threonine-protein kinase
MTRGGSEWARVKSELLAVLELEPGAGRERLAVLADTHPELAAEVAALVAGSGDGEGFLEVPALERAAAARSPGGPDASPPERVGPWRLESEVGHGGMGTVWRARRDDGAFEQTVAVKFVRPELATDLLRRRLAVERRILAGLEHESIARLLDGGVTAGGVPYLVLEFVDGQPIDAWCDQRALPVVERLRLFLQVCAAVEFAHRKLVLHRDLKSSNVLVDERGRPKLLDFGIAKLLGPEPAEEDWTALGLERPLTPEWASPEQLRGDALTTASDVYSLGVLLCSMLTGERPHRWTGQSPSELARQIEDSGGGPVGGLLRRSAAPGVERRALRGDLERILARALAPEPDRRYGTAAELAADVERYLDGRPVAAHPPSTAYRLRKLVRRHRAGFAAAALVALSLVGGAIATLRETRVAEAERARAERRFADVRRLANVVLFDVYTALDKVSGAMAARRLLVDNSLRYLDDLAKEAGDEPALLTELAAAYERVGEMQGLPEWQSEGRTGDALASFERALELRRRVRALAAAAGPGEVADAAEARVLGKLGSVLAARGETAQALVRHRESLTLLERAASSAGAKPSTASRLDLAQALVAVGDDIWELGDVPTAALRYGEALSAAKSAVASDPESTVAIRQVGVAEQRLGDAAAETGDWPRALEHHGASLAVDRELARRLPDDVEIRRDLGTDLSRVGVVQQMHGSPAAALAAHQEATRLRAALLAEDPTDARAGDDLAESRYEAGKALVALGRPAEAAAEFAAAVEQRRALLARDPGNARWSDALASLLATRADFEAGRGDRRAAEASLAEALAIRRRLAAESPDYASNRAALEALERHRLGGG